jgi:hypothetical protein
MALTEQEEFELLSLEREKSMSGQSSEELPSQGVPTQDNSGSGAAIAIGSGAAAAGAGLYAGGRIFNRPARQIKAKENLLDEIKTDYLNKPFIASGDVPGRIQLKGNMEQQEMKSISTKEQEKLSLLKVEKSKLGKQLGNDLADFDNQVLNKTVEDFGLELKKTFPKVVNTTYDNYTKKLNEYQGILEKKGMTLKASDFADSVLNKTGIDAIKLGVPEAELGKLFSLRDVLKSTYRDDTSLTLSHLKGNVDALAADLPKAAAIRLKDNWGEFMHSKAKGIVPEFDAMQKDYVPFANMRNSIYDEMQGGEFDTVKVNKMMYGYANGKAVNDINNTVKLMAEGNNIVTGMPEIKPAFEKLQGVISARKTIESSGKALIEGKGLQAESSMARINEINTKIQESKLNAMKWTDKAEQLLSEQAQIATKYPHRAGGVGKAIMKTANVAQRATVAGLAKGLIGRAIMPIQVISAVLQANEFISDPAVGWGMAMGVEVPKKGTPERAVLESQINKKPIPPEMNISEEEQYNILLHYGMAI